MSLIAITNLTKTYGPADAPTHALRGVTCSIDRGEFVAIMGPSGSGKSTLLHILGLLDVQTSGSYTLDGQEMRECSDDRRAHLRNERMGFVFQQFNLLVRTSVLENTKLPLRYSRIPEREWDDRARSAIARVGLEHRLHHTPAQLSGGEQQRAAIARALVLEPSIIFADEPTGNLDTETGRQVMVTIETLYNDGGRTIILITHESQTARHAHRIFHLTDGMLDRDERVGSPLQAAQAFQK